MNPLLEQLLDEAGDWQGIVPAHGFAKDAKHLIGSGIQKTIRRGDARLSMTMAAALFDVAGPSYTARRLSTIAVEDCGLANPVLVAQVLLAELDRPARTGTDPKRLAVMLAERLANSEKDSTACDLALLLWKRTDGWSALDAARQQGELSPTEQLIANLTRPSYVAAGMGAEWSLACKFARLEALYEITDEAPGPLELTPDGLPLIAADMHTPVGGRVAAYFGKMIGTMHPAKAVGWAIFVSEGNKLNARRTSPLRRKLKQRAIESYLYEFGIGVDDFQELTTLVAGNLDKLSYARKRILGVIPSSRKPVQKALPL